MTKIFVEENGVYEIDFTNALWATDHLNTIFDDAKIELADVDFIAETSDEILFVEYKNASIPNASKPEAFKPIDDKKISQVVRKYYDSLTYIISMGKNMIKRKVYIYILEFPNGDAVTRKLIRNKLQTKLPFLLQEQNKFRYKLIDDIEVLSINEWNKEFPDFPLKEVLEV